ncbi:MAG TPA: hypothetical protein DIW47_15445 [Bacteroidetes bacterium]|nr:hypothetical protein [Bacteroidota bacterium]
MWNKQTAAWICVLALLSACSSESEPEQESGALARVYDKVLYLDDLPADLVNKAKGKDSIPLLKAHVKNWVLQQVSMQKAKENLNSDIPEIEKKVQDYRNSLMVYEYQRALFEQLLDTTVDMSEISTYYENNLKNFELKRNIVRLRYVKLPLELENTSRAKSWFLSDDPADRLKLQEYCAQFAENTYMDEESWLSFEDLLKEIPLSNYNQEHFLRTNKFVELKDNDFVYWLYIHAFRIKNSVSPLELEAERIRSILINKRKLKLLEEVEGSLLKEAEAKNEIEWFIE